MTYCRLRCVVFSQNLNFYSGGSHYYTLYDCTVLDRHRRDGWFYSYFFTHPSPSASIRLPVYQVQHLPSLYPYWNTSYRNMHPTACLRMSVEFIDYRMNKYVLHKTNQWNLKVHIVSIYPPVNSYPYPVVPTTSIKGRSKKWKQKRGGALWDERMCDLCYRYIASVLGSVVTVVCGSSASPAVWVFCACDGS